MCPLGDRANRKFADYDLSLIVARMTNKSNISVVFLNCDRYVGFL